MTSHDQWVLVATCCCALSLTTHIATATTETQDLGQDLEQHGEDFLTELLPENSEQLQYVINALEPTYQQQDQQPDVSNIIIDSDHEVLKRTRWAKNNLQVWGKRHARKPLLTVLDLPLYRRTGADAVGTRLRKKLWEKNNFKMWGKRSTSSDIDVETGNAFRGEDKWRNTRPVEQGDELVNDDSTDMGTKDGEDVWRVGERASGVSNELNDPQGRSRDWLVPATRRGHGWSRNGWASNNMRIWG
jgi:hypothetical protein